MMAKGQFQDPDIHTPAHDAIMMWLEENACELIYGLLVKPAQVATDKPHVMYPCETEWEAKYYGASTKADQYGHVFRNEYATPRYIDMLISAKIDDHPSHKVRMACEVKPAIRSVGELIRQLRQYESNNWDVAVVSPDDRFRAIIEKQGFIFIKAPQPEYGPQGGLF